MPMEDEKTMPGAIDTDQVIGVKEESVSPVSGDIVRIGDFTEEELLRRARGLVQQRTKTWKVVDPEKHAEERIPRLRRDGTTEAIASGFLLPKMLPA